MWRVGVRGRFYADIDGNLRYALINSPRQYGSICIPKVEQASAVLQMLVTDHGYQINVQQVWAANKDLKFGAPNDRCNPKEI